MAERAGAATGGPASTVPAPFGGASADRADPSEAARGQQLSAGPGFASGHRPHFLFPSVGLHAS